MYSAVLSDEIEPGIRAVFLTILAVFFVLMIASWWLANKDWQKDEAARAENSAEVIADENIEPE